MYHAEPCLYWVCTWYVLVYTLKNKMYNYGIRTMDLMQSILHTVPLRYQRAFHGEIECQYKVYNH